MGLTVPASYQDMTCSLIFYHGQWRHFQESSTWLFLTGGLLCRLKNSCELRFSSSKHSHLMMSWATQTFLLGCPKEALISCEVDLAQDSRLHSSSSL